MLVVAAEDYTGASPVQTPGPHYLQYYLDALAANGIARRRLRRRRARPHRAGRSSACSATTTASSGTRATTPSPAQPGGARGNADRLALDEMLEMRAYMDEGGRVLYTGKQRRPAVHRRRRRHPVLRPEGRGGLQARRPGAWTRGAACCCAARPGRRPDQRRAAVLVRRHASQIAGDGQDETAPRTASTASAPRSTGLDLGASTAPAARRTRPQLVVHHDERHPAGRRVPAVRELGLGALGRSRAGRSTRTPAASTSTRRSPTCRTSGSRERSRCRPAAATLTFWTSYDTEPDWDFLAVEARTAGRRRLDDAARRRTGTRPARTRARAARDSGLARRCTRSSTTTRRKSATATCTPTGTDAAPGTPRRATRTAGSSGRSTSTSYAGKTVEISIAYISDWGTQNLGVFLDDFTWPGGRRPRSRAPTLGGWQITGPPAGSGTNANNCESPMPAASQSARRSPPRSHCCSGFGFEGISTAGGSATL